MKHRKLILLLACGLVGSAQAVDLGYGFTLKGFGTAGLANSSSANADYVSNSVLQGKGPGIGNTASMVVDSKLGLQLSYEATDHLSFVAQGLSKQQYNNSYVPVLEWAYAKYKLLPELDIRAGRIRPAVYMLSDYLDVNYANPWVRPPTEFYSTAPIDRMEGVDFLWRPTTGDVSWLVQPYFGVTQLGFVSPQGTMGQLKADNAFGINLSATYNELTLRGGFAETTLTLSSPNIAQGMAVLSMICGTGYDPTACSQMNAANSTRKTANFMSLGATWDNGDYFVMSEFGKRTANSYAVADITAWYISGGARIEKVTPYITYSQLHNDSPGAYSGDRTPGYGALVNQVATQFMLGNAMNQGTITLGARYDFMSNFALKAQWDHIQTGTKNGLPGTGSGLFASPVSSFANGSNQVDLFSVSLDFVF
jgi:hypothetical protein